MINLLQAVFLSIIQGISEWFPISSSGHLALIQNIFGFQNLPFDVFLHFASIFAAIIIFWKDILKLLKERNFYYIGLLVLAMIPAFLFGMLLKEYIVNSFHNLFFIGLFFIFSGAIIYSTKFVNAVKPKIGVVEALFIGLMQVFALFPGISRSGMTISGGLFSRLKKQESVRFSFILAIPVILGASLAEAPQILVSGINYWTLIISFFVSFLVSLVAIKLLLRIIKSDNFWMFGIYNFVLGLIVLGFEIFY